MLTWLRMAGSPSYVAAAWSVRAWSSRRFASALPLISSTCHETTVNITFDKENIRL